MSPLYRDLYVQLAGSGLRSTQNSCAVGNWRSSNQEKLLANDVACDLYTADKHTAMKTLSRDKVRL